MDGTDKVKKHYTRSHARGKNQVEDDVEPEDSVSNVSKGHSSRVTTSSRGSNRSKEQLKLDISSLEIKMSSHEKRARLQKNKLEIELDMEQNDLSEQLALARNENEIMYEDETSRQESGSHVDISEILGKGYTLLGTGKVDVNGEKACRVYGASRVKKQLSKPKPSQKTADPEEVTQEDCKHVEQVIAPTSIDKKSTVGVPLENKSQTVQDEFEELLKRLAKDEVLKPKVSQRQALVPETEPAVATATRNPQEEYDHDSLPDRKEIGYFPSPERKPKIRYELPTADKALETLYRQQTVMMGALQAPKIELMEFHGDPMSYHAFIRSFEENVEKMLPDDGARLVRLIHLCQGEAGRAIRCCNLMDPKQGYARARRLLEQRFGDSHTITELWIKKLNEGGPRVNLQEYADELLDCYESLKALGALQEMHAQRNLLAMITGLPMHLQNKWQDHEFDLRSRENHCPTLKDVVKFVD